MRRIYFRSLAISGAAALALPALTMVALSQSRAPAGEPARSPIVRVQSDPCSCRFQYDGCRVPCGYAQGAAAIKGCIDRCLRQLRECRANCRQ